MDTYFGNINNLICLGTNTYYYTYMFYMYHNNFAEMESIKMKKFIVLICKRFVFLLLWSI